MMATNQSAERILIVSSEFPPGPGGIGDHAWNLANQLALNGFRVTVLSERRVEFGDEARNYPPTMRTVLVPRDQRLFHLSFLRNFLTLVWAHRADLIIASGSKALTLVGPLARIFRIRTMAILHGHEAGMDRGIKRWVIRNTVVSFTSAIAVSRFSKGNFAGLRGEISVITNGFNQQKFSSQGGHQKPMLALPQLLTVGTISRRKGQHNVVQAMPLILKAYPGARYVMAGITYYADFLRSQIESESLQEHCLMLGVVPDQDMPALFSRCDIFIMLSENTQDGNIEGFGIAIIEANYFGLPAIGSRGCGIEDAIKDGYNGRLVDGHSPDEILAAIEDIRSNYDRYSQQAVAWAMNHRWPLVIQKYLTEIQHTLQ